MSMPDENDGFAEIDAVHQGTVEDEPDPADAVASKPWTVKNMPVWVLEVAKSAAQGAGLSMGEWLTRVIPEAARPLGEGSPGLPAEAARFPSVISRKAPGLPHLVELRQTIELAALMHSIDGLPKAVLREAHGLLRDRLKAARQRPQ